MIRGRGKNVLIMLVALDQVFGVIHDVATEGDYSHNPMSDIINRVEKLQQDIYQCIIINPRAKNN